MACSDATCALCARQAKEVPAQSAAWASEFADKQRHQPGMPQNGDFEDVWKNYGQVPTPLSMSVLLMALLSGAQIRRDADVWPTLTACRPQ